MQRLISLFLPSSTYASAVNKTTSRATCESIAAVVFFLLPFTIYRLPEEDRRRQISFLQTYSSEHYRSACLSLPLAAPDFEGFPMITRSLLWPSSLPVGEATFRRSTTPLPCGESMAHALFNLGQGGGISKPPASCPLGTISSVAFLDITRPSPIALRQIPWNLQHTLARSCLRAYWSRTAPGRGGTGGRIHRDYARNITENMAGSLLSITPNRRGCIRGCRRSWIARGSSTLR